jgi:hypothetical protein
VRRIWGLAASGLDTLADARGTWEPSRATSANTASRIRSPSNGDVVSWRRYGNCAWPATYLIDRRRKIRFVQIGEGRYAEIQQDIETLLSEQ